MLLADRCTLSASFSSAPYSQALGGSFGRSVPRALALSLLVLGATLPSLAKTWTVTNTTDSVSDTGSLRYAINHAQNGDMIVFGSAVTGTITLNGSALTIASSVTIIGSGASHLAISGNGKIQVFLVNTGVTADISGMTIENALGMWGGGIENLGTLTVSDSTLSANSAHWGGGIWNQGTLTVINSTLSGNSATGSNGAGGGIYNGRTLTVINSTLLGNLAPDSYGVGGGIYNYGTLTVDNGSFSGNRADKFGGGIFNNNNSGMVTETTTEGQTNTQLANPAAGGGIGSYGKLTISNSTFSGNIVSDAYGFGGGIENDGTLTMINSTLSGNNSARGGGILNTATLIVSNSTLAGNKAALSGGNLASGGGSAALKSTILANAIRGGNCDGNSSLTSKGYNLSDDGACARFLAQPTDQNSAPAGLSSSGLKNNGGPTQTIALSAGSKAIDAIPASQCTDASGARITVDQRGISRPQGAGCDIGAFELVPPPPQR